jgi:hypothetical protein
MQELVLRLARGHRVVRAFELATRPLDPRHSVDVCLGDDLNHVLILIEVWNTIRDLGAAARSTDRKRREAEGLAAISGRGAAYRVAVVWIVRASAPNRTLIGRYPEIFRSRFPGSSRIWVRALVDGSMPPIRPGLVWCDPSRQRLVEWRPSATD